MPVFNKKTNEVEIGYTGISIRTSYTISYLKLLRCIYTRILITSITLFFIFNRHDRLHGLYLSICRPWVIMCYISIEATRTGPEISLIWKAALDLAFFNAKPIVC